MSGMVSGKLAFISGAASGIGRATCQVLAREGATIVGADKNANGAQDTVDQISKLYNNNHLGIQLDVKEKQSIKKALKKTIEYYKRPPTILVHCAAINRDNFIVKLSEEDFDEVLRVNLNSTFLMVQTFANALVANGTTNGSLINIGSIVGKTGNRGSSNYVASKAGVELLTKTAAKEFGKFGIRCNVVLPGYIDTPMVETIPDKVMQKILSRITTGRLGKAEEVAEVIAFLASDRSSYVNGASIEVTGGM